MRHHASLLVCTCPRRGCVVRSASRAHHAFATEFDAALEGEVKGEVTRVWWQNPHIRYDVTMKMPDGSTQSWALLPPGNCRRIGARTGPSRRSRSAIKSRRPATWAATARRSSTRRASTSAADLKRAGSSAAASTPGTVSQVTADPNVDYTVHAKGYDVDISGYWDNRYKFQSPSTTSNRSRCR
jgi:hypothetical protein